MQKTAIRVEGPRPAYLRPVSSTIGRLGNLLGTLPMLHPEIPFKKFTPERQEELKKVVELYRELLKEKEDTTNPDDLAVYLGGGRPYDQLKKMWKRKEISIPSKLWGTTTLPIGAILTALTRGDHYNPFSRTATVYNPEAGILAHELGHDIDFSRRKYKLPHMLAYSMLTGAPLYYEGVATRIATQVLKDKLDKLKALKEKGEATDNDVETADKQFKRTGSILSPAYGSYVGNTLSQLGMPAGLAAAPIMRFIKPEWLVADPKGVDVESKVNRILELRKRYIPSTQDAAVDTTPEDSKYANLRKLT